MSREPWFAAQGRPRLLDLFCGAGGCAKGYQLAGFDVVGVDHQPQPNYPFHAFEGDALAVLRCLLSGNTFDGGRGLSHFHAIHASPPCQAYTSLRTLQGDREYADLIEPTRELLKATGLPYVIENVEGARRALRDPVLICGSMFDPPLDVKRHRYFEANWPLEPPMWPCRHKLWDYRYPSLDKRKRRAFRTVPVHDGGQVAMSRVVGVHGNLNYAGEGELRSRAMEIDWMTQAELTQAIPPAYTELIGRQLLQEIRSQSQAHGEERSPLKAGSE
jgi:DNA (cytosine-5)-methyltransferase 1